MLQSVFVIGFVMCFTTYDCCIYSLHSTILNGEAKWHMSTKKEV